MQNQLRIFVLLGIALLSLAMHGPHLGKDLIGIHVWRQTQTQSAIVNFYEEDMNIFNPRRNDRGDGDGLHRMEFPLMQWMVACLYKVFGRHLVISRLFMWVVGLGAVLGIYSLLKQLFEHEELALMGAWAFNFSPNFYYFTINPMPDNMSLATGIWGLALFFRWYQAQDKLAPLIWSGLMLSISALCKLPFILYYIVPLVFFAQWLLTKGWSKELVVKGLASMGLGVLPLAWYAWVIPTWGGNMVIKGMLNNEDSGSQIVHYLLHNLVSALPELLLNYGAVLFFLAGFYFLVKRKAYRDTRFGLILSLCAMLLTYFFFEVNAIADIHAYYLFPFYPVLFMLVGYGAYHLFQTSPTYWRYVTLVALFVLPLTCYLRMANRWNPDRPNFNKDFLEHKAALQAAVPKEDLIVIGNDKSHFILFYHMDKKGWCFDTDQLPPERLKGMIEHGATHLYIDSEVVRNQPGMDMLLDSLVMEKGSVRVYRLNQ